MRTGAVRTWGLWMAVVAAGCAHKPPAPSASGSVASQYYPLEVGRSWTYQARLLGAQQPVTVRILREENGFFHDSQGGELKADAWGIRDRQRYLLQNPIEEGHAWTNVLSKNVAEHYRIVSVGVDCDAPAGKYSGCVVVESSTKVGGTDGTLINQMTFAPGIGLVRSSVHLVRGGTRSLQSQLLLQSYLAPPGATRPGPSP